MRLLILSLLAMTVIGCATNSPVLKPEQRVVQKQEAPTPTIEPTPYQRLRLTRSQSRQLQRALPQDARRILEQADEIEVISVDVGGIHSERESAESFWKIPTLGKVRVTDEKVKTNLVNALFDGIATSDGESACFIPHHGLRAKRGTEVVELLICFQCRNFVGSAPSGEFEGAISKLPHETFNTVLTSASVPLSGN